MHCSLLMDVLIRVKWAAVHSPSSEANVIDDLPVPRRSTQVRGIGGELELTTGHFAG